MPILKKELDALSKYGVLKTALPEIITANLNPAFPLRDYQKEALFRLIFYITDYQERIRPTQLLFHMATGSGKTLIMAAAILYLYQQGYRNFIFFVNSTNIIEKTRDNFLNPRSSKYLFAPSLKAGDRRVSIQAVENFQAVNPQDINILFTTVQGLHSSLNTPRENALTYEDFGQRIVLISDEAHHINALTKSANKRNKGEAEHIHTWEATVNRIFNANLENLLLEFTATVELSHPAVAEKYRDKILYQYSLKEFREDGFSKEVKTLQADLPPLDRALQAVVVSQYRRKVAEDRRLRLKPVILMKSRTIRESEALEEEFRHAIAGLAGARLQEIASAVMAPIVQKAFAYFEGRAISWEDLAREIQVEFAPAKCLVVNSKSESEEKQLLVNSLEDGDNEIRVVFAVDKLNEGWDVLNLFDIVRLYNTRDAKAGKPGKTTIAEAQLIGRGARYFPFQLAPEQPRHKRKYDNDLDNDMRVLEELYYHSAHNPRYIQELHQALRETGMMPEHARQLRLNIKESFKQSSFWENGFVFVNERVRNDNAGVFGLQDALIPSRYSHTLRTGYTRETYILDDLELDDISGAQTRTVTVALKDLGPHLLRFALARLEFYRFANLKTYFPHLPSISHFITSEDYLAQIKIDVTGAPAQLDSLNEQDRLNIAVDVLQRLAADLKSGTATYIGSKEFKPQAVKTCVRDKAFNAYVKPGATSGLGVGMRTDTEHNADLSDEEWYVYDENYGTSEEKALIKFIQSQIDALRDRYTDIYLLRNQKLFQLYNFGDGRPFEPDFVLFLTEKVTGKSLVYQLFIEPKGQHLISYEQWKEAFLKQIEAEHRLTVVFQNRDYKLVGLPFYNEQVKKQEFEGEFQRVLLPKP
ncbi:MAG: type III deoxyribonuclease [Chloroflexi bacterium]|nr:MAG: type III deoxyribonuclease [Chloroflexota bacterium]